MSAMSAVIGLRRTSKRWGGVPSSRSAQRCPGMPQLDSAERVLGALYVVEGSAGAVSRAGSIGYSVSANQAVGAFSKGAVKRPARRGGIFSAGSTRFQRHRRFAPHRSTLPSKHSRCSKRGSTVGGQQMSVETEFETIVDTTNCDREQIHIPGLVLPHGVMLVLDPDTFEILQAAGDAPRLLGKSIAELPGSSATEIFNPKQVDHIRALVV